MTSVLTKEQVQDLLKLTDKQTSALFRMEDFPCFRIGNSYRITEDALFEYLHTNRRIKLDYGKG